MSTIDTTSQCCQRELVRATWSSIFCSVYMCSVAKTVIGDL